MSKKNNFSFPKKYLPPGSVRIKNNDGERVWLIEGQEFASKNEYFQYLKDKVLAKKNNEATPTDIPSETKNDSVQTPQAL